MRVDQYRLFKWVAIICGTLLGFSCGRDQGGRPRPPIDGSGRGGGGGLGGGGSDDAQGAGNGSELVCGDERVHYPEECDPPDGILCDESCRRMVSKCGDSTIQLGEACDPPDGVTCSSVCGIIPQVCGNSILQHPEECDPPDGVQCDSSCRLVILECGDGIVQAGEDCDPPNGKSCDDSCLHHGTINLCPDLGLVTIAPLQTSVGATIDVSVEATDADNDALDILWIASSGTLSDPSALSTTYLCREAGRHEVFVQVSDNRDLPCSKQSEQVEITCVDPIGP